MMNREVIDWLQDERGIDPELADALGLESTTGRTGAAVLAIPYIRGGERLGRKFRAIGEKRFACDKGMSKDLWNVDCLTENPDQPIIITEGELDAISVIQAGHRRAVSIPDGWTEGLEGESGEGEKVAPLFRNAEVLKQSPCVIVAGDTDATGQSFVRAVATILEGHPVRFCEYPENCKDPNDVLRRHGEGALAQCIAEARFVDPPGGRISTLDSLPPVPNLTLWKTGIPPIDRVAVFEKGALGIGTGYPGHGKSTLFRFIGWRLAVTNDIRVAELGLETPVWKQRDHLYRMCTGYPFDQANREVRERHAARFDRHWRVLQREDTDDHSHDVGWLKKMIHTAAVREQCGFIIVDPWNELEHITEFGEARTDYINLALSKIRNWGRRYGCHIFINAHPTKTQDESKPPLGYQIADSAAWFNKPDLGLTVYLSEDEGETRLINWKARDRESYGIAHKAMCRLEFDPDKMVFRGVM